MEKIYNIILHNNYDQNTFLNEVVDHHCHCVDECNNIPNVIVMKMDESHIDNLKDHPAIKKIEVELSPEPANLPSFFLKNRIFTGTVPLFSVDPKDYGPLQFYYLNDQLNSNGLKIGTHRWTGTPQPLNDDTTQISGKYFSCWLGKNVDIVTLEVTGTKDAYVLSTPHPDFIKIGTNSTIKFIPNNWTGLSNNENINQVGNTNLLTSHAIGVLSAAAGTYCGYAKESNLYALYIESVAGCINSVINWHNGKSINPSTGLKNPTILIHEYQYLESQYNLYKIEDITQFTYYNSSLGSYETITRPVGGWNTDFTPFTSRNFNLKKVLENGTYFWCIGVGGSEYVSISNAIQSAYDNGIINLVAAGNDCGVYVKRNDPNYNASITIQSSSTYFQVTRSGTTGYVNTATTVGTIVKYPFRSTGPHASPYAIDVAAGQNSERHPILDHYTTRGPGVDIVGLGNKTWTSYPSTLYADGNYWGMFSGTSSAVATVAGILACLLEKYYYYHSAWPTPLQAKEILLTEAKKGIIPNTTATTWNDVPNPTISLKGQEIAGGPFPLLLIYDNLSLNGGISNNESLGTPNVRAFIDTAINKENFTKGTRPVQGQAYPRNRIRIS